MMGYRIDEESFNHASKLTVFIADLLNEFNTIPNAIAVSAGPGSYTGLRIGASTAKGLAYSYKIQLISVDTLTLMAHGFIQKVEIRKDDVVIPLIDARRNEVYMAVFDSELSVLQAPAPLILHSGSMNKVRAKGSLHFIGSGSQKAEEILEQPNGRFFNELGIPTAMDMGKLAYDKLNAGQFEDVAYFEPFYLKDFFFTSAIK